MNSTPSSSYWFGLPAEYTQDDELMNESVADLHTYIRQVAIFPKVNSRTDGQFSDPLSLFSGAIGAAFWWVGVGALAYESIFTVKTIFIIKLT